MDLSAPCLEYIVVIVLPSVKKLLGINPMVRSDSCAESIEIIALGPVHNNC